ncbi:transglutaminase family protein [Luteococcus peritonei]|uniref:Transglutaminase family protein n=1 Tax=Luteococcus peritonei TaxID=88874 RepID=A0ABW4RTA1_9ACTN
MSRIRIVHRTGYRYGTLGAKASFNEVRMTPLSSHEQLVMSNKVDISPTAWQHAHTDYWGTQVLSFEVHEQHEQLMITASSDVDVHRPVVEHVPQLTWQDLADPVLADRWCEFLQPTEYTTLGDVAQRLPEMREVYDHPADYVRVVSAMVRERIDRVWGAGRPRQQAREAWQEGAGSVQDVVHLVIGALRHVGIPARYVAGYVLPSLDPPLGVSQPANLHAWLQFWDGEWVGLDPLNACPPGEEHIEVGYGRDYADVMPLFGIFTGGQTSETFVEVELTKVS